MKNYKIKNSSRLRVLVSEDCVCIDDELEIMSLLFIKRINITSIRKISISLNSVIYMVRPLALLLQNVVQFKNMLRFFG